jgi:hypothetical protein
MKSFLSFLVLALTAVLHPRPLFAQALEPIGGPYTVDTNTVVLFHFDGTLTNEAAAVSRTGRALTPHSTNIAAKISYFDHAAPLTALRKCIRLDNSSINDSTYLTLDDTTALDLRGEWTIEAWVNIFTFGMTSADYRWVPRVVMKPGDDVFWRPNYWLEMWGDNRLFHAGYYTTGERHISLSSPNNMFVPGEWVHLAFIRDTARAFIACMVHDQNRKLRGFITRGFDKAVDIPKTNNQKLHIGWAGAIGLPSPSTDSWLDGFVDEVRISKVVRNFAGPPVIQSAKVLPNQSATLPNYPVEITVFPLNAGGRMASVQLKYRADTVGAFTSVDLAPVGDNKYTGVIPRQAFRTRVQYYYKCTDNNGMTSFSPIGAEDPTPTFYSFWVYQENVKTLDVTFEEMPPVDHSPNKAKIITRKVLEYSSDVPIGGGRHSLLLRKLPDVVVDSNWVEAESPFLAAEEFTLDVWLKADSADLPFGRIIINPTAANDWNNANFELSFRPGPPENKPVYTARYWDQAGGVTVLQDNQTAATHHVGKWRRIIVERNKTNGVFAMAIRDENDALIFRTSKVNMSPPRMAAAPLRIGRSHFLTDRPWFIPPFRGKIDNVKVYNYPVTGITSVPGNEELGIPWEFSLAQNYPNPFNPATQIEFTLPKFQHVSLVVYDVLGRKVKTLIDEERRAGQHRVTWAGTNDLGQSVSSGVYFYQLKSGDLMKIRKMILVR